MTAATDVYTACFHRYKIQNEAKRIDATKNQDGGYPAGGSDRKERRGPGGLGPFCDADVGGEYIDCEDSLNRALRCTPVTYSISEKQFKTPRGQTEWLESQ